LLLAAAAAAGSLRSQQGDGRLPHPHSFAGNWVLAKRGVVLTSSPVIALVFVFVCCFYQGGGLVAAATGLVMQRVLVYLAFMYVVHVFLFAAPVSATVLYNVVTALLETVAPPCLPGA